ncbi:hypothetical protein SLA2020_091680 [Shorea laevis]
MVARLTPDQKVACSIHVGFKIPIQPDPSFFHFCVSVPYFLYWQPKPMPGLLVGPFFNFPLMAAQYQLSPPNSQGPKQKPPAAGGGGTGGVQ